MGAYSNQANWADRLKTVVEGRGERSQDRSESRRGARRLRDDEVSELARGYREGASVYELAERFGIHRTTVSGHLHRAGVTIRRQGLDEQQVHHAAQLHRQGWPMARIGDHFGVDYRTALSALRTRGIPLLDARGH